MSWYYAVGQEQKGPVTEEQLQALAKDGAITGETLVWREGLADWQPYRTVSSAAMPAGAPGAAPPAGGMLCAECGKAFALDEVVRFGDRYVCAACKPTYVQRMAEGVVLTGALNYASVGLRFGAKILDSLILWVVNTGITIALGMAMGMATQQDGAAAAIFLGVTVLIQISVNVIYGTFFLGKFGATPGKMACKIKVVRADGSPLTYGRACGRVFAEILSGLTCSIGYIMAAFDEEKRSLHDRICDTRVIQNG
ncbi:MAG: hypothetical protein RL514_2876 [Verrucomicrobiota bacterium]|jgi:uncharacterized RDD family membrane protein YckC